LLLKRNKAKQKDKEKEVFKVINTRKKGDFMKRGKWYRTKAIKRLLSNLKQGKISNQFRFTKADDRGQKAMINTIKREILGAGQKKESKKLCLRSKREIGSIPRLNVAVEKITKDILNLQENRNKPECQKEELRKELFFKIVDKILELWDSTPRQEPKALKKELHYYITPFMKEFKKQRIEITERQKAI
jgi:DTW domain-containing protein YfiP